MSCSYKIYISSLKLFELFQNLRLVSNTLPSRYREIRDQPNEINSIRFTNAENPGDDKPSVAYRASYRSVRKLMRVIRHVIPPPITQAFRDRRATRDFPRFISSPIYLVTRPPQGPPIHFRGTEIFVFAAYVSFRILPKGATAEFFSFIFPSVLSFFPGIKIVE